eukprot:TRINITY_DN6764_c0_g1_i1.p1 TRINITY_DN6764_c0_g1~~TRINITY_DN6764_c0_g1_i1.p1  ORF type:complete len:328 (+),score=42.52 TRINITY_DN6764_c0_g1_i1:142-984(+)
MALKFVLLTISCFVLWDIPFFIYGKNPNLPAQTSDGSYEKDVFDYSFGLFGLFLNYSEKSPPLFEWRFRSGLDHYIAIYGMLFAWAYPTIEKFWIHKIELSKELSQQKKNIIKGCVFGSTIIILLVWWFVLGNKDKFYYNTYHPYTSWIPVTCYVIFRNCYETVRERSIVWMGWIGRMSLEMYLLQFHVWLCADAKKVLWLSPLWDLFGFDSTSELAVYANFILFSIVFCWASNYLLEGTGKLIEWLLPNPVRARPPPVNTNDLAAEKKELPTAVEQVTK